MTRAATVCILTVLRMIPVFSAAGAPPPPSPEKAAAPYVRQAAARTDLAAAEEALRFFRTHGTGYLVHLAALHADGDRAQAHRFASDMVERFAYLQSVKARNPDEYERLVAIEEMTARSLVLARRVREEGESPAEKGGAAEETGEATLDTPAAELTNLLERIFEARQQNQLIEINRLEAEVREMRRLLEQRQANKEMIVGRRYTELTGQSPAQ